MHTQPKAHVSSARFWVKVLFSIQKTKNKKTKQETYILESYKSFQKKKKKKKERKKK